MLSLFAKKTMILGAPAEGDLLDITQVSDPFFASKNLGDGIAVNPHTELVCAPCDGKLIMLFETRHAFGIRSKDVELLIHIGMDTVEMQGQGFTALKKVNAPVRRGEPIIRFDRQLLSAYDLTGMMLITKASNWHWEKHLDLQSVKASETVMTGERL